VKGFMKVIYAVNIVINAIFFLLNVLAIALNANTGMSFLFLAVHAYLLYYFVGAFYSLDESKEERDNK